jgi:RNA polymerase sigma-70 factor (ECF subfamily)
MDESRRRIVAWVGAQVLPHEAEVRAWLRRSLVSPNDREDILQEAYCRLSALHDVAHITSPRSYFFQVVRNVLLEQVRRARIVQIETVAEIDALDMGADEPSPEQIAIGRRELARVMELIAALPERCRRVVELRKIHGVSQREIAARLGVTEGVVENEANRGLRLVLAALADTDAAPNRTAKNSNGHERLRQRNTDQ